MASKEVTTVEEHTLLMESPDLREQRRQQKLGALPVRFANILRGTKRGGKFEFSPVPPVGPLPDEATKALKEALRKAPVLRNRFTKGSSPRAHRSDIDEYVMGGNKRNKRVGATPEAQADIDMAKMRQTQHIADKLQKETLHRMRLAELRREALKHVRIATRMGRPYNETAALWASDAIEDLGISLREHPDIGGTQSQYDEIQFAGTIEHIGAYTSEHPELLAEHLPLVELAQLENEKRYKYWGRLFYTDVSTGRNRLTKQNKEDDHAIVRVITGLRPILPPVVQVEPQ